MRRDGDKWKCGGDEERRLWDIISLIYDPKFKLCEHYATLDQYNPPSTLLKTP